MAGAVVPAIRIQREDFDVAAEIAGLTKGRADIGAVVTFSGLCRDEQGALLWDGDRVRSRHGQPARTPAQFLQLQRFFEPQRAVTTSH